MVEGANLHEANADISQWRAAPSVNQLRRLIGDISAGKPLRPHSR